MLGVHSCWLDKDCRHWGVPPFLTFNLWWVSIRLNPIYTPKYAQWKECSPWTLRPWHWVQVWRNRG